MSLALVPVDEENSLIPIIEKIGRAVKFEYTDEKGELIESEGIIEDVNQSGVIISIYNPLCKKSAHGLTTDPGLHKYFPFTGREAIVRIRDIEGKSGVLTDTFVNSCDNIRPPIEKILEA